MKITHSALALLVGSSLAFAATKEFSVIEDNSMRNEIADGFSDESCYSANSDKLTVVHFCCWVPGEPKLARVAMKFDLSDINKKEVKKATLEMKWCFSPILKFVGAYGTNSGEHEYSIYDVEKEWSAESLSWDGFSKAGAIGVDRDEDDPISTTTLEKPNDKETVSFDVTSLATKWVKDNNNNKGLIISAPNTIGNYFAADGPDIAPSSDYVVAYFYSNEADEALRPKLIVEYDDSPVLHSTTVEYGISIVGMKNCIRIDAPMDETMLVTVSNIHGKRVASKMVTSSSVTLGENLHSGIYFVSIEQDGFTFTKKVVLK